MSSLKEDINNLFILCGGNQVVFERDPYNNKCKIVTKHNNYVLSSEEGRDWEEIYYKLFEDVERIVHEKTIGSPTVKSVTTILYKSGSKMTSIKLSPEAQKGLIINRMPPPPRKGVPGKIRNPPSKFWNSIKLFIKKYA